MSGAPHRRAARQIASFAAWIVLAVAAVAAAAAAPAVEAPAALAAAVDSVSLPAGEVRGLAWLDGATLAVLTARPAAAGRPERIYLVVQDRTGAEQSRVDLTGRVACGLAYDGGSFWSAGASEGGGSGLHRLDAGTLEVLESYPIPGHRPTGVAWDGAALWLCDRDSGLLHRFDPATGEIVRSGRAPAFSPQGLAWDGAQLLIGDFGTGRLHRIGPALTAPAAVPAAVFGLRARPVALAWRGGSLWVAPAGGARAYELLLP